jgi:hypothetical protein
LNEAYTVLVPEPVESVHGFDPVIANQEVQVAELDRHAWVTPDASEATRVAVTAVREVQSAPALSEIVPVGGTNSGAGRVEITAPVERFPAASTAQSRHAYVVPFVRPVRVTVRSLPDHTLAPAHDEGAVAVADWTST